MKLKIISFKDDEALKEKYKIHAFTYQPLEGDVIRLTRYETLKQSKLLKI
jgi:hypothetical protein